MLGITKAYTTRVGSGPFPTELTDDIGAKLGKLGHEFGTVTGRAAPLRLVRCRAGAPGGENLRHPGIALTKLDVLDGLENCASARPIAFGPHLRHLPGGLAAQKGVEPKYEEMEGWRDSSRGARSLADLPAQAVKYVRRIEELVEAP